MINLITVNIDNEADRNTTINKGITRIGKNR